MNHIVPDSGATSHMLRNRSDFEDDYVRCTDVFVLMGDNSEIPVLGYGIARVKINGKVIRLVNSLHVPDLDVNLFSCTRHGSNGKGNTFFLGDGKMHLTFPTFTVTDDIPADGDLKVPIQPLSEDDWAIPNFVCDGVPLQDKQLTNFGTQLAFLDNVLKGRIASKDRKLADQLFKGRVMTRAQRKEAYTKLKHALGRNLTRDEETNYGDVNESDGTYGGETGDENDDAENARDLNPIMNELPDNYLYEGSPDKMMMDALKELNIDDIRDFLKEESPNSKPFEKEKRAPPPRYHLESSRGDVKDRLTSYQLQSYFGGRHLTDYSLLSKLGTGLTVIDDDQEIPTIGELVNRKRGKRRRKGSKATVPLEVVGMDIGYGEGTAYGGSKYVFVLVDQCTSNSFVYGM